jgi:hypothetical protein
MTRFLIGAMLSVVCALSSWAGEESPGQRGANRPFAQKQAEILARIEQKIAQKQEEKVCVQAATSRDDLDACRDKFRDGHHEHRSDREDKR